jgi:endonuclease YncB( thermonuclease family)
MPRNESKKKKACCLSIANHTKITHSKATNETFMIPSLTQKRFSMMRHVLIVVLCLFATSQVRGQDGKESSEKIVEGKVKKIVDGDSIIIVDKDKKELEVQLEGIDAPEAKQDYGSDATKALVKLISGKEVIVKWKAKDSFERILGKVYVGEQFVNLEMIRIGAAWHFKRYNKDEEFAKAEEKAREVKLGLWAESSPAPPWDFRKNNKTKD